MQYEEGLTEKILKCETQFEHFTSEIASHLVFSVFSIAKQKNQAKDQLFQHQKLDEICQKLLQNRTLNSHIQNNYYLFCFVFSEFLISELQKLPVESSNTFEKLENSALNSVNFNEKCRQLLQNATVQMFLRFKVNRSKTADLKFQTKQKMLQIIQLSKQVKNGPKIAKLSGNLLSILHLCLDFDLQGKDFSNAQLEGACLEGCQSLYKTNFFQANLREACFERCQTIALSNFIDADMREVRFFRKMAWKREEQEEAALQKRERVREMFLFEQKKESFLLTASANTVLLFAIPSFQSCKTIKMIQRPFKKKSKKVQQQQKFKTLFAKCAITCSAISISETENEKQEEEQIFENTPQKAFQTNKNEQMRSIFLASGLENGQILIYSAPDDGKNEFKYGQTLTVECHAEIEQQTPIFDDTSDSSEIVSLSFSGDGKYLVSLTKITANENESKSIITVWKRNYKKQQNQAKSCTQSLFFFEKMEKWNSGGADFCQISKEGSHLVSVGRGIRNQKQPQNCSLVKVWMTKTGALYQLVQLNEAVSCASFALSSLQVLLGAGNCVKVWDLSLIGSTDGQKSKKETNEKMIKTVAFHEASLGRSNRVGKYFFEEDEEFANRREQFLRRKKQEERLADLKTQNKQQILVRFSQKEMKVQKILLNNKSNDFLSQQQTNLPENEMLRSRNSSEKNCYPQVLFIQQSESQPFVAVGAEDGAVKIFHRRKWHLIAVFHEQGVKPVLFNFLKHVKNAFVFLDSNTNSLCSAAFEFECDTQEEEENEENLQKTKKHNNNNNNNVVKRNRRSISSASFFQQQQQIEQHLNNNNNSAQEPHFSDLQHLGPVQKRVYAFQKQNRELFFVVAAGTELTFIESENARRVSAKYGLHLDQQQKQQAENKRSESEQRFEVTAIDFFREEAKEGGSDDDRMTGKFLVGGSDKMVRVVDFGRRTQRENEQVYLGHTAAVTYVKLLGFDSSLSSHFVSACARKIFLKIVESGALIRFFDVMQLDSSVWNSAYYPSSFEKKKKNPITNRFTLIQLSENKNKNCDSNKKGPPQQSQSSSTFQIKRQQQLQMLQNLQIQHVKAIARVQKSQFSNQNNNNNTTNSNDQNDSQILDFNLVFSCGNKVFSAVDRIHHPSDQPLKMNQQSANALIFEDIFEEKEDIQHFLQPFSSMDVLIDTNLKGNLLKESFVFQKALTVSKQNDTQISVWSKQKTNKNEIRAQKNWKKVLILNRHLAPVTKAAFVVVYDSGNKLKQEFQNFDKENVLYLIISCSQDKLIKLWNADTGQNLHSLLGHTGSISDFAFAFANQEFQFPSKQSNSSQILQNLQIASLSSCELNEIEVKVWKKHADAANNELPNQQHQLGLLNLYMKDLMSARILAQQCKIQFLCCGSITLKTNAKRKNLNLNQQQSEKRGYLGQCKRIWKFVFKNANQTL